VKYIYDILLNFDEMQLYDFFEWDVEDDIEYFKKVPILRIKTSSYKKIVIGNTIDDSTLLDKIYNATEVYDNKRVRKLEYALILTNGKEAVAVLLDKKGQIIMMSRMLVDEEEEVIEIGNTMEEQFLNVLGDNELFKNEVIYLTRHEYKKKFFLNKEIDILYTDRNVGKLKYLYYECSNEMEDDIHLLYDKIKLFLNQDWNMKHEALYDLVRLSYSKK